jgi:hypothetical protein
MVRTIESAISMESRVQQNRFIGFSPRTGLRQTIYAKRDA